MSKISEAGKAIGNTVADAATQAVDWVKEKTGLGESTDKTNHGTSSIREHMDVVGSDGNAVGLVDRVEGNAIKLTRDGSTGGVHHFIPMGWVERVDSKVHLNKTATEAQVNWKLEAASCGCGG